MGVHADGRGVDEPVRLSDRARQVATGLGAPCAEMARQVLRHALGALGVDVEDGEFLDAEHERHMRHILRRNGSAKPDQSVFSPIFLPSFRMTVFTAPRARALSESSSRYGMMACLQGCVMFSP